MLQINPNEVIRISKLMNNSIELIEDNIKYFKNKYANDNTKLDEILQIEKLLIKTKDNTTFLEKITNELVAATGESLDNLLNSKHSLSYYNTKFISHYATSIFNNESASKLDAIDLCYNRDSTLDSYCQKQNFMNYYKDYLNGFNPAKYGLTEEEVKKEIMYVYETRGASEAYALMRALVNNEPENYQDYHFNPKKQMHPNSYYDYDSGVINNYETNSEIIDVNGYKYEFAQVLPKDCTKIERLAYNFGKANVINTMKTLPDKYLKLCSEGDTNAIILTCNTNAMNNIAQWSGYYKPSSIYKKYTNMIAIDIHGSFNDNVFYTQDTIIHELGHKFDDVSYNKSIIDKIFGRTSYTSNSTDWDNVYKKYKNVLNSINFSGYEQYPNVNEFFGDATVAYFKKPDVMKALCPEVYVLMNNMLDGEYGYSYNDKIVTVLSASNL